MTPAAGGPSRVSVWLGSAVALAIGLPILAWGIFAPSAPVLTWYVPVSDAIAIVCMLVVALLGALDASLRHSRRSLPLVFIASATSVMWAGHFAFFPGDVPALRNDLFNQATAILYLAINVITPALLTFALVQRGGPLVDPTRAIVSAIALGALFGFVVIAVSLGLAPVFHAVTAVGRFEATDALIGAAGMIPALFGLAAFFVGLHGDERIAGGVLAALTFSALSCIDLLYQHARYTPSWYADRALALLPLAALIAGQLWLYTDSVLAERRASAHLASAAKRRRIGLDVAEAMARETDPLPVIDRLLGGVLDAVQADRVTMLRVVPGGLLVDRSVDRDRVPANIGVVLALDAVVSAGRPFVMEAMALKRPVVVGSYTVKGVDPEPTDMHALIRRCVVMPLVRAGDVDGVLMAGRRSDRPFTDGDVEQLEELSSIAALLIRNARFLAEVESQSRAKSNFINLAAHELGTPIAVIKGYLEMLADHTLGPVDATQRSSIDAVRSTVDDLSERVQQLLIAARMELAGPDPDSPSTPSADLPEVVRDAVGRARDRAELVGAEITQDMADGHLTVQGSPLDIGIILDNLLNNAMTYSREPARIRVEVSDGAAPVVRVADSGIGIPEDSRERIFDQFYRVDDAEFGYPAGTGLGLYISRRLAERCGAQLFLERSSRQKGSVFALRLKRRDVGPGATAQARMPAGDSV